MSSAAEQAGKIEAEGYHATSVEIIDGSGGILELSPLTTSVWRYADFPEMDCIYTATTINTDGSSEGWCIYESPDLMQTLEQLGFPINQVDAPDESDTTTYWKWYNESHTEQDIAESNNTALEAVAQDMWDVPRREIHFAYMRSGEIFDLTLEDTHVWVIEHSEGAMTHLTHVIRDEAGKPQTVYIFEPEPELLEQLEILRFTTTHSLYPTKFQLKLFGERTANKITSELENLLGKNPDEESGTSQ